MNILTATKGDVKSWICAEIGSQEALSLDIIQRAIEDHNIDGKLLCLLNLYRHEIGAILPNLRARLLFLWALDNFSKRETQIDTYSTSTTTTPSPNSETTPSPNSETTSNCGNDTSPCSNESRTSLSPRDLTTESKESVDNNFDDFESFKTKPKLGIPDPVPLPKWDTSVEKAIEEGRLMEKNIRRRLIKTCAKFYLGMKPYPSQNDYSRICSRLVSDLPQLKDPVTLPGSMPFLRLKSMLSMMIRNLRRARTGEYSHMRWRKSKNTLNKSIHSSSSDEASNNEKFVICENGTSPNSDNCSETNFEHPLNLVIPNQKEFDVPMPTLTRELATVAKINQLGEEPWKTQMITLCVDFYTKLKNADLVDVDFYFIGQKLANEFNDLGTAEEISSMMSMCVRNVDSSHDDCESDDVYCESQIPLPPLDVETQLAVQEGKLKTDRNLRNRFIRICAKFYMTLKCYPTKDDYKMICERLVTTYPDLKEETLPGYPPYVQLKRGLTACIRNKRREILPQPLLNHEVPFSEGYFSDKTNGEQSPVPFANHEQRRPSSVCESSTSEYSTDNESNLPINFALRNDDTVSIPDIPAEEIINVTLPLLADDIMFPFPPLSAGLLQAINEGRLLTDQKTRSRFLYTCAQFYLELKYNLTKDDYSYICKRLLEKYPMLADNYHTHGPDVVLTYRNLKKDLSSYVRNTRYRERKGCVSRHPNLSQLPPRVNSAIQTDYPEKPLLNLNNHESDSVSCSPQVLTLIPAHPPVAGVKCSNSPAADCISYPSPIPPFSHNLALVLESDDQRLDDANRRRFLHACAIFYTGIKYYPSKQDYNNICLTLYNSFQLLANTSNGGYESVNHLKRDLSIYIRNLRHKDRKQGKANAPAIVNVALLDNESLDVTQVDRDILHLKELLNEMQ